MKHPAVIAGLVAGAIGAALAGCSYDMRQQANNTSGMGLHFNSADGMATLAFGPANADATGLVLQCHNGSRQVEVSDIARRRGDHSLVLISGDQRNELPARIDETMGVPTLWANTRIDAPALQAFRRSGEIRVGGGAGGYSLTANGGERAGVEQFFRACEVAA